MSTTSPALPAPAVRRSAAVPAATADAAPAAHTGRGLGGAVLGYLVAVVLVITLAPFEFRAPGTSTVQLEVWTPLDLVANVLLFAPLGFLHAQARRRTRGDAAPPRHRRLAYDAMRLGLLFSIAIELAQLCVPERYPSPWDVLANGAGAALGAVAYAWVHRRLDPARMVGRLGLELPLMGIVYLLVPLGWVAGLSTRSAPERWWLLFCLGLFGASILGAVQRRHFGPAGLFSSRGMAVAAAGWFVLCALPALTVVPRQVLAGALVVGGVTWFLAAMLDGELDRRFERSTLLRAAPYFAAYLLLLAFAAPVPGTELRRALIFQMMETMAAFTLLGYATAEWQGRRELAAGAVLPLVVLVAGAVAVATTMVRGASAGSGGLAALLAALAAAAYGGWLYHLQRAHVRALAHGAR